VALRSFDYYALPVPSAKLRAAGIRATGPTHCSSVMELRQPRMEAHWVRAGAAVAKSRHPRSRGSSLPPAMARLDLKRRETQMGKTSSLRVSGRGGDFSGRLAKGPNTKFSPIEPLCPLKECTERTDRPARRRGLRGIQRLRWNMSATEPRPSDCAKAMYMKSDPVRHDCMLGGLDGSTVISIRGCASATFGPNAKARERRAIFR
jgi:hypothetical protein